MSHAASVKPSPNVFVPCIRRRPWKEGPMFLLEWTSRGPWAAARLLGGPVWEQAGVQPGVPGSSVEIVSLLRNGGWESN